MNYYLMKSEPECYSWEQMLADKRTHWDGVRNYQARNAMQAMKKGDQAFFYHSNTGKAIQGIVEIMGEYYPDMEEPKFGMVDVKPVKTLAKPITLCEIKSHSGLEDFTLLRQSQLSVMKVTPAEWKMILSLGNK